MAGTLDVICGTHGSRHVVHHPRIDGRRDVAVVVIARQRPVSHGEHHHAIRMRVRHGEATGDGVGHRALPAAPDHDVRYVTYGAPRWYGVQARVRL